MTDLDREVALAMGWERVYRDPATKSWFGVNRPKWGDNPVAPATRVPSVTDPAWLRGALLWCAAEGLRPTVTEFQGSWVGTVGFDTRYGNEWDPDPGVALAKAIVAWRKAQ